MLVLGIIVGVLILYTIFAYNNGIKLRNYVKEAFSTMDVYLKKRWDLVPNLVETVKAYTEHEKDTFSKLTELRTKSYTSLSPQEKIDANKTLGQELSKLIAVAENYPDLKANQNYAKLMEQLSEIENDIANSRKYYNGTVRTFNTFLEVFPSNLIAAAFHFEKEKLYEIEEFERENVKVQF